MYRRIANKRASARFMVWTELWTLRYYASYTKCPSKRLARTDFDSSLQLVGHIAIEYLNRTLHVFVG